VLIATEAIGVGGVDAVIRSGALAAYGFTEGHVPGGPRTALVWLDLLFSSIPIDIDDRR
jgi:hypothetical protein